MYVSDIAIVPTEYRIVVIVPKNSYRPRPTNIIIAVCNAVFHATGIRVREIPIRLEDLLRDSKPQQA